jgi:PKD repeat protein
MIRQKKMITILLMMFFLLSGNIIQGVTAEGKKDPYEDITKLKWMGPHGSYEDYLEQNPFQDFSSKVLFESSTKENNPWIMVFINSTLLPSITNEISMYNKTLQALGYRTLVIQVSGGAAEDVKSVIVDYWNDEYNITGIVLVGDLPVAWYNLESEGSQFPCDLYLMDLDGEWTDTDTDGMYETHIDGSGDTAPEIFIGRIDASNIPGNEIVITKSYFSKVLDFWEGTIVHTDYGLTYTEEDWSIYDDQKFSIEYAYEDYEAIWYPNVNRDDYMNNRLNNDTYEFIQLSCHSWSNAHYFTDGGQATSDQIRADPPKALFYNLFCCGTLRFTDYNCVGNAYILDTDSSSLAVVGSTKSGSMLDFEAYYSVLSDHSFGKAFQLWFESQAPYSDYDKGWFYGMTILGDPTLFIEDINIVYADFDFSPTRPIVNETVAFTDASIDYAGVIVNWTWDFGDGTVSYQQNPVHQYEQSNLYSVCLTIEDDQNSIDTRCKQIIVLHQGESLDVNQPKYDRGFPIRHALDGDWAAAQNFTSMINTLTKAEIYLRKFGTPEFNLTVELRENHPQGNLIDALTFTPEEVPSSWEWFPLDFQDTVITSDTSYFIVIPLAPNGVTTSFGYEWGYAFGNQYNDGSFWFTRDGGGLWRDLPTMYEFTFRTYGYDS